MSVLHGTGQPKLVIDPSGTPENIILPYPKTFREFFKPEVLHKELYSGSISTTIKGWWYSAELDYGSYIAVATLQSLDNVYDKTRVTNMRFYPRNSSVYYSVELDPETALMLQQRSFNRAHKNFVLKLIGTARLSSVDLTSTS